MIVQPLDALKERLRESRLFSEENLDAVCSGTGLACNDDSVGVTSSVTVNATAGISYTIVVEGWNADTGSVVLNISTP